MTTLQSAPGIDLGLTDVTAVRERYRALYEAAVPPGVKGPAALRGGAGPLPPYACRLLNRGDPLGEAADGPRAHLGTDDGIVLPAGAGRARVYSATALARDALDAVALTAFRAVRPGPRTAELLADAVEGLSERWPEAAATVGDFTSVVVWLKPLPLGPGTVDVFASYAFPGLPFLTFLTGLAARHLAPGYVFPEPSRYALQESLYQEALHHRLDETQRTVDHFVPGPGGRHTPVPVPWHGTEWTAAHCLATLFVHVHLAPMRAAALARATGVEREVLAAAHPTGLACAYQLLHGLTEHRGVFSDAGAALLEGLGALLAQAGANS
jgi:hypothetical protein